MIRAATFMRVLVWPLDKIRDATRLVRRANVPDLQAGIEHRDEQQPAIVRSVNLPVDLVHSEAGSFGAEVARELADSERCDRPWRAVIGDVEQGGVLPGLADAIVGGV